MNCEYSITYLKCQSCTAKIHCDQCADELCQRLLKEPYIRDVSIDIPKRSMHMDAPGADEMDLLDLLEEIGLFAD